jgi:hypothetical protein
VPDFGPSDFVPRWGATATGVRKFLIAYNINVLGTKEQAHRSAFPFFSTAGHPSTVKLNKSVVSRVYLIEKKGLP